MEASIVIANGRLLPPPEGDGPARADPMRSAAALAIAGRRIVAVGGDEILGQYAGPGSEIIDAGGATVMPGFNDAHMHLRHGALALDQVDLFGLTDLAAVQRAVAEFARSRPTDAWVTGRGWLYAAFPGGLPTAAQLDVAVADRPALLMCFDGHSGWANTRALELSGIDASTPDPPDGAIVRDDRGAPTGALKERAVELVAAHLPQIDERRMADLVGRALVALAAAGITAAQDAWAEPSDFRLLDSLRERLALPVRLRLALEMLPRLGEGGYRELLSELGSVVAGRAQDPFLRGGILKSFLDGVVEARTAYMLEPYAGTASRGDARWQDDELHGAVAEAHARGWQVELHAIGSAAVRQALDAYSALGPGEAERRRHRIEHIETIDPSDLPRFAQLGVVASMQPFHAVPDSSQADTWRSVLGAAVAGSGWRISSLLRSGARLAFGSDWPVVPYDPFLELHAAVNRQTVDGKPADGWLPDERVSLRDALDAATHGASFAEHAETERGALVAGALADVIVLDRDLLAEGRTAILGTQVRLTVVDGRVVHRRL